MKRQLLNHKWKLSAAVSLTLATTAIVTHGCKPRRGSSALRALSAEDNAQEIAKDMTAITTALREAQSDGWPQLYIDPEKLKAGSEGAVVEAIKMTPEDGVGWPVPKQIKGIIALSDTGRGKLMEVNEIIQRRAKDPESRKVARMGVYFISWLLHEMGVQYEVDALDENLRTYYSECDTFSDCGKLLGDIARFADLAPGPTVRLLVGNKGLSKWYGSQAPTARSLFAPDIWFQLIQSGFPTQATVEPSSIYGRIYALQTPLLRDILAFHAHNLLLDTIFKAAIAESDVTVDKSRNAFVRQPSGKIPTLPDNEKAILQARISELKTLHSKMTVGGSDPNAPDKDKDFVERIKKEMLTVCTDEFKALPPAEGDTGPVSPTDVIEASAKDVSLGFVRALEGVLVNEVYLRRVNMRDIRPWLDSLVAGGTEVAALTLASNMKRETALPSAEFYNRATAQVIALSPRIIMKDSTGTPQQMVRPDYKGIATAVDELTFYRSSTAFGMYGRHPFAEVEKDRTRRGGFLGALLDASVRKMGREEEINGCRTMSNEDMMSTYFIKVGESYRKLSVAPNARENADPEDPYTKTANRVEIPRLKAFQQDLANRFPLFHSMIYQSALYTRAALRFGYFQKELMKSEEEKARIKAEQSTIGWIGEGLGNLLAQTADGLTVIVTISSPSYQLYRMMYDPGSDYFYDPNFRGDFKEISKGFDAQSDAAMKDYMHQFLALNCYNFMTADDATFRRNPSVCGPNGKPFKLASVCLGLPKDVNTANLPIQWLNRWTPGTEPPNIERNIVKHVDAMEQADFRYQINTMIANTAVQIPLMMVSGAVGSMIVRGVTGAIAARLIVPLVKFTDYFMKLPINLGAQFANASINMASFALVHKSLMFAYQTAFATVLAPDKEAEYTRARLAFYDPQKTFFENYGEELASGSFLFFVQPAVGMVTDKVLGRLLGIKSSEHFYNLGKGAVGKAKYWESARKVMFIAGTGTADGIFFFSMPFLETRFFSWIEGTDPNEKLKHIGQDFAKEFGNSFATALAFRVHGNLGGHFSNGPNAHRVDMAALKYIDGLKRFRDVYDKAIAEPMANGKSADPAYTAELAKESKRIDAEEARLKDILGRYLEQSYLETRGPGTPKFDRTKAVEDLMQELRNVGDHNNENMAAAGGGNPPQSGRDGVAPPIDDR